MTTLKRRPSAAMVPLFSRLSIMVLLIGVILGTGAGVAYWKINSGSPSFSSSNDIKIVSPPGSTVTSSSTLTNLGQYYTAEVNSLSFYQYLIDGLNKQAPERSYTLSTLSQKLNISYFAQAITFQVTTGTANETEFLITNVPKYFESYLIAEENKNRQQDQQNIQKSINAVQAELLKAEQDQRTLQSKQAASDVQNNPTYMTLTARLKALEVELDNQASQLSASIVTGDNVTKQLKYQNILQQIKEVNAASASITAELQALEQKKDQMGQYEANITLDSMISGLQVEIDKLMNGYTTGSGNTLTPVTGLAQLIAEGNTLGTEYSSAMDKINKTSTAIAEAKMKKALLTQNSATGNFTDADALKYQLAQIQLNALNQQLTSLTNSLGQLSLESVTVEGQQDIPSAFTRLSTALVQARNEKTALENQGIDTLLAQEMQSQFASSKVDSLTRELATLNNDLSSSLSSTATSGIMDWLVVGKPSSALVRETSMKLSTILVISIFLGICIAWLILNFRWLSKSLSKSFKSEEEDGTKA
jgi:hypothetical protein